VEKRTHVTAFAFESSEGGSSSCLGGASVKVRRVGIWRKIREENVTLDRNLKNKEPKIWASMN